MGYNTVNLGRYRISPKGKYDSEVTYNYLDMVYTGVMVYLYWVWIMMRTWKGEKPCIFQKFWITGY